MQLSSTQLTEVEPIRDFPSEKAGGARLLRLVEYQHLWNLIGLKLDTYPTNA
jgi:hypothetical protein